MGSIWQLARGVLPTHTHIQLPNRPGLSHTPGGEGGEAKYFSNFSIFEVAGFMFLDGCLSPDVGLTPEKRFKRFILPLRGWIKFHSRLA